MIDRIADALARLALGMAPAHHQVKADPRLYAHFVGRYQVESVILDIVAQGERLFSRQAGHRQLELFPESEYGYFHKAIDAVLTFERNAAGKVEAFTLDQGGRTYRARRLDQDCRPGC